MIIGIIGSRTFDDYELLKRSINLSGVSEICSGGAKGADSLAEKLAGEFSIPIKIYYPDWKLYGKIAGFRRNSDIVSYSDKIYAFWDGESKGTLDSINKAKKLNKPIMVVIFGSSLDI